MTGADFRKTNREVMQCLAMPSPQYLGLLMLLLLGVGWLGFCFGLQVFRGMQVTGLNSAVGWGTYITNFVFWIGIGHAGTLISAILFLLRVRWRTAVSRVAETMTVFAVMTAGMFPMIHLGRVWVFYWLIPYPNASHLWPNFKSPLLFDVVAITAYLTISVLFWYLGLIPDLAAVRDSSTGRRRWIYGLLAVGWHGGNHQWRHYARAYVCMAALATPLVISVHSIVSWDFAVSVVPGWHETLFAPYFVAGAIHSGLAMVITLLIPLRAVLGLRQHIRRHHFEAMASLLVLTGLIVLYAYVVEAFMSWYGGHASHRSLAAYRAGGHYAPQYWMMVGFNGILPLAFLWREVRRNWIALFVIGVLINVGMWLERYVIIVSSLSHDYLPSSWQTYSPSWVEISISVGAGCFFLSALLVALRVVPGVALAETKAEMVEGQELDDADPDEALAGPQGAPSAVDGGGGG